MKIGDAVIVHPHGDPEQKAAGKVVLLSENERAIAVAFGDMPPMFASPKQGYALHPQHGVIMLATRAKLDDKPWGPWVETFHGGHYEIEEETRSEGAK